MNAFTLRARRVARTPGQKVVAVALAVAYDAKPDMLTEDERAFLNAANEGMLYHRINMIEHYCPMPSNPSQVAQTFRRLQAA